MPLKEPWSWLSSLEPVLDKVATLTMLVASVVVVWVLLDRPAGPPERPDFALPQEWVSLENAERLGDRSASVVVIEYSDFECPFCARFTQEVMPSLKAEYVDRGVV